MRLFPPTDSESCHLGLGLCSFVWAYGHQPTRGVVLPQAAPWQEPRKWALQNRVAVDSLQDVPSPSPTAPFTESAGLPELSSQLAACLRLRLNGLRFSFPAQTSHVLSCVSTERPLRTESRPPFPIHVPRLFPEELVAPTPERCTGAPYLNPGNGTALLYPWVSGPPSRLHRLHKRTQATQGSGNSLWTADKNKPSGKQEKVAFYKSEDIIPVVYQDTLHRRNGPSPHSKA